MELFAQQLPSINRICYIIFQAIGINQAGYILYIELIALGTFKSVDVEPMNVFRVAVMKNASRVILVHNHPSRSLIPSEADKDITDRLIQVGHILNIGLVDHLIITPKTYISFRGTMLMDELEQSLKYVPTYQVIKRIRKEEKQERLEKLKLTMATVLLDKGVSIQDIAKIMDISVRKVNKILG